MKPRYIVTLSDVERAELQSLISGGTLSARKLKRAQILLAAEGRRSTDAEIAKIINAGTSTVYRTKKRFVEEGLQSALNERSRRGADRLLSAKQEAILVATACSPPPKGRCKWTLSLLAGQLVALTELESVSTETIRRRLKEKKLKPWQKKMWCIPKMDAAFVACMEDVLDLYAEPHDPKRPVVNFDEALHHLVSETRVPIMAEPGKVLRYDYEYRREGSANIFLFFDQNLGWRHAKVTKHKCNLDFAECMRDLVDVHYTEADVIRVVLDNLVTHRAAALYTVFPPEEARRILRKIEFHYTPKHASWLNMVEIEIGVMRKQCLGRRIGKIETLADELHAWENERNVAGATIDWLFDVERARRKLARGYPKVADGVEPDTAETAADLPQEVAAK